MDDIKRLNRISGWRKPLDLEYRRRKWYGAIWHCDYRNRPGGRLGWQLTIFLATSVQILHVRSGRRLTFPSLWRLFLQLSFWTGARMLFEKDGKRNSNTEWRIYYSDDVLPSSSPRVYKSFTFVQDDDWRFPHYDALPSPVILNGDKNSIWERQGSGTVTQSEESITLMTSCR